MLNLFCLAFDDRSDVDSAIETVGFLSGLGSFGGERVDLREVFFEDLQFLTQFDVLLFLQLLRPIAVLASQTIRTQV